MVKRRRTSLKKLYADLKAAPPNLASLELTDTGFRATFFQRGELVAPNPAANATLVPPSVPLVPGTAFPDDGSPINAADLVLNPIDLVDPN